MSRKINLEGLEVISGSMRYKSLLRTAFITERSDVTVDSRRGAGIIFLFL